jgi:hypothetical protein
MVEKPLASHYATFKRTVIGFTAAVAVEHGSKGITGGEVVAMAMLLASAAGAGVTSTAINADGGTSPY